MRLFVALFGGMIVIDQLVKLWARNSFAERQSSEFPWPGVFEFTLTYNKGIAFGMLQGFGIYLAPIAIAIAGGAFWYVTRHKHESVWMHVSLGLIASGAVGNLIDRIWLGKVTDMFSFRLINFPVFNVADSCITVGAILLVLIGLLESFRKPQKDSLDEPVDAHE